MNSKQCQIYLNRLYRLLDRHSKKSYDYIRLYHVGLSCKERKVVKPPDESPKLAEPPSRISGDEKAIRDKTAHSPERTKVKVPLDILISLLRPDELVKLQKYIAAYLEKQWQP